MLIKIKRQNKIKSTTARGNYDTVATAVPSSGQTWVRQKEHNSLENNVPRNKVASSGPINTKLIFIDVNIS